MPSATNVVVKKLHTLSGHRDCVYAVQIGKEPYHFFSGAGDGSVVLWDLRHPENGQQVAKLPNSVYAIHYHREREELVVAHNYDGIHVIDPNAKKELRSLQLTKAAIFDIASVGGSLMVATGDGTVIIVDMDKWAVVGKTQSVQKSARTMALNPLAGEVAVGYSDFSIRIFDIDTWKLKKEWVAHQNSVFTLVYTPDHKTLLSGSRDARLKAWNADGNYEQVGEVVAHLYAINNIVFSPDGKHFVTCSLDKSIKVWSTDGLQLLKVIDKARHAGHGTSVNKLLWTHFENQLVSASDDRTISVWDLFFDRD